ncbi:protein PHR1-LIKE 1 isoform X1 [Pyrus x bretschneideri]|uniref:protein PHR1-LIKE 1 isoform X1 n=1 Tax=Pyrus x bretschneideri TaxID=225117 RepID=UPI0020307FEA|nr:protein PHR1-LIKE 1 isoform X1 [Pyrus x bretschneideri]
MSEFGASKAMSSSFPRLHTPLDDKYSNLPDSFQVSSQGEKSIYSMQLQASSPGNLFPSASRPNEIHISSVPPCEQRSQNSPFICKSPVDGKSLSLHRSSHSPHLEVQPTALINYPEENKDISWCPDSLQDFLHFSESVPDQNGLVDSSAGVITSEEHAGKTNWSDWDPLISFDDALDPNWELPVDVDRMDPKPKQPQIQQHPPQMQQYQLQIQQHQPQIQQHQSVQAVDFRPSPEPLSSAPPTKSRMRWTQELHEAFVEAVNHLGGSERGATPKGIVNLMKVEGLTIYHVKSHLQKYRTARYKPESSEVPCEKVSTPVEETNPLDVKGSMGITEALRLQVELQKRLHEQLENQRKLQLKIEQQGKYLEKMFEQQRKIEDNRVKSGSSTVDDHPTPLSDIACPSTGGDKQETSTHQHDKTVISIPLEDGTQDASREAQEPECPEDPDGVESGAPPTKRARNG